MTRRLTPVRLAAAVLLAAVAAAAVLAFVPSGMYIFLPHEARPVEPLVTVKGERPVADGGGIYFVDVLVRRATLIERLFPGIREGSELVSEHRLNPSGVSERARRESSLREMTRSQAIAAAVALRELGYDVDARPAGALIAYVDPELPAGGKLRPSDVIVGVGKRRVRTPDDLREALSARPAGTRFAIRVRRGRAEEVVAVSTTRRAGRPVIGVVVEQEASIELPIDVSIDTGEVGGPSAGLAFALDLLEELGRDVDGGYKVAATGAIELDGDVVAIGGVQQKTIGARRSGVDVFLVPAGRNAAEARRYAEGLRVIPVSSFQQALRRLATLPARGQKG